MDRKLALVGFDIFRLHMLDTMTDRTRLDVDLWDKHCTISDPLLVGYARSHMVDTMTDLHSLGNSLLHMVCMSCR